MLMWVLSSEGSRKDGLSFKLIRIEEEVIRCPVCCKCFGSKKAMHGHMRCHPERGWRGTVIPTPAAAAPSATAKKTGSAATSTDAVSQLISEDASLPPKKRRYHHQYDHAALSSSSSSSDILDYYYYSKQANKQVVQKVKVHRCRTCHKTFPTGQALGGHQTTHRQKIRSAAQAAPTPRQNANPRVFYFDLNELPPMEQED